MTVSIGRVHSAGGAATYFASDNYYSTEQGEATSQWAGEGAAALGLIGRVDTATFERTLDGRLPDGSQVGDPATRDHGRDFTFSMPKSASLLALVSGDGRILAAHVAAVKDTMKWAEANLAEARIKVDGKDVPVRTGNLVYALFQHDTSRATDPQSHVHAVIAMGAGISAFGAGVVAASEGGLVAALLTARVWRLTGGGLAIGLHGLLAFLAAHLLVALVRGIREPRP